MPGLNDLEKKALYNLQQLEKRYNKQIQKALEESLDAMRIEMQKIYDKYAKDGILTKVEMTKYNKYQIMERDIVRHLDPAILKNKQSIKYLLPEMYHQSFFQYAWAIDNVAGVRLSWGAVNKKAISELFSITNPKNIEMMEALKNYGPAAKRKIRAALLHGLGQGKSYGQMIKDLRLAHLKVYSSFETIVRTEGQRALNKGTDDVYLMAKEKGINGKVIWDATLDGKTRPSHGRADGTAKSDDGYFHTPDFMAQFPLDPNLPAEESINCRCRERFEIDGYEPQLRRAREQGIIPYQNYIDYAKEYHPEWLKV